MCLRLMMDEPIEVVDITAEALEDFIERTRSLVPQAEHEFIRALCATVLTQEKQIKEHTATIARLRRRGRPKSEKKAEILGKGNGNPPAGGQPGTAGAGDATPEPDRAPAEHAATKDEEPEHEAEEASAEGCAKPKGHGRIPASAYAQAEHTHVPHPTLRPGDVCPDCERGKLYKLRNPVVILRIIGQSALVGRCWDLEGLRCGACQTIFKAPQPEAAQGPKCDETAGAMLALLHYGAGMPMNRLEDLQSNLGTPLPASTQWDVLSQRVEDVRPAHKELFRLAAQGDVVHNDDTHMGILEFMGKRRAILLRNDELADPDRTGLFTTGFVSIVGGRQIALFITGRKHAGENFADLLKERAAMLGPPKHMCDGLSRNLPDGHPVIQGNCNTHARRQFVDEVENFPEECEYLLDQYAVVYGVEARCKKQGLSPEERLRAHQLESGPVMEEMKKWMTAQLTEKRIEPNSGMGKAINYVLKRWDKLTLFLREPGAPIDNNVCERILKMAIRHRRNSLFYKTEKGADVGDVFMTLIYNAKLNGANPFDYLTELMRNARAVADNPADWLPWNYRDTLARLRDIQANAIGRDWLQRDAINRGAAKGRRSATPPS